MKKILFFLGCLSIFGLFQGQSAKSVQAYNASEWTVVKTAGDSSSYWNIGQDNIIGTNNQKGNSNFLVSNTLEASGDYSISVNITGTMGFPNTKETQAGIVPWYVDDNNYVVVYLQWRANERPNELNQVQVTGRIDGQNLSIWKDGWDNSSEWNDWWTDGNTTASNSNIKFTVDRYFSINSYRYVFYINDAYIGEHGIRSDMASAKQTGKMGIFSYNDTFTFTNFSKDKTIGGSDDSGSSGGSGSTGGSESTVTNGDYEFVSPNGESYWSIDTDENITGDGKSGTTWLTTNALKSNKDNKKNFFMTSTIEVSELGNGFNSYTNNDIREYKVGIVPYYLDTNNYVFVWLSRWNDGDKAQIIITAKFNGVAINPEWIKSDWLSFDIIARVEMEVEINENTIRVYLNNKTNNPDMTTTIEGLSNRNLTNSKVGLNIFNVSAKFSKNEFLLDERGGMKEKPVITVDGKIKTTGIINEEFKLPVFVASNSNGLVMTAVVTVTDPDNEIVTVSRNKFIPTKIGIYKVKVTCKDVYNNEADPLEYTIDITNSVINDNNGDSNELFNSQLGINPDNGVSIATAFVTVGAVLSVIAVIVNIILRKKLF